MESRPIDVLHTLGGLHVGGISQLLRQNISTMDPELINSSVCYFTPRHDLLEEYRQIGIEPVYVGHSHRVFALRTLWRFIRLIRRLKVDLIHANHRVDQYYASLAGRLLNIPVVATIHEVTPRAYPLTRRGGRFRLWLELLLMGLGTKHYIAVSQAAKDIRVTEYGEPADKITVVHSGLKDIERFADSGQEEKGEIRRSLGVAEADPLLLNVARLDHGKGHIYLPEMMRQVVAKWPNSHLLIAGEGSQRSSIEDEIAKTGMGDHVTLLGRRSDVPRLLRAADVFVFPGVHEAFGIAVVEAMAAGLPVVSTDAGGLKEVVADGVTGRLVSPHDPDALAKALLQVLDSPEQQREFGEKGRERVAEKFSASSTALGLQAIYQQVLREHRGS